MSRDFAQFQRPGTRVKSFVAAGVAVMLTTLGSITITAPVAGAEPAQPHPAAAVTAPIRPMAPGNPGVPGEPAVLFTEDFQNVAANQNTPLADYTGATGTKYTAAPYWLNRTNCNGFIVDAGSTRLGTPDGFDQSTEPPKPYSVNGDCTGANQAFQAFAYLRSLGEAIGNLNNSPTPKTNAVAASYTQGGGTANAVQFQTVENLSLNVKNRFITFSVDVAAHSCGPAPKTAPKLSFSLVPSAGAEIPATKTPIDVCKDPRGKVGVTTVSSYWYWDDTVRPPIWFWKTPNPEVRVGSYASDKGILMAENSLGLKLINAEGSGAGNDSAFDNIRVLDVTPQLDKSFSPTRAKPNEPVTLTFTVTNRSDLGEKIGWGFTDNLPAGLKVADVPNVTNTCAATVTAAAGSSTLTIANGTLAKGEASCTISVNVTSETPGPADATPKTYVNGPGNISSPVGIDLPADATVEFYREPRLALEKTVTPTKVARAGDAVTYNFKVTNTGEVNLSDITIVERPFEGSGTLGPVTCTPTSLGLTEVANCSASYTVTQADVDRGSFNNVAKASGALPAGSNPVRVDSNTSNATVTADPAPALTLAKSAVPTTAARAGDEVTFNFDVTNTGNVTLSDIQILEGAFDGPNPIRELTCPATPLAPGDPAMRCTAKYTLSQADVNRGSINNTATASGQGPTPPGGTAPPRTNSNPSNATVPVAPAPALTLVKSATPATAARAGDEVTFNFDVTNTGNVTLSDIRILEGAFDGPNPIRELTCPATPLAPGDPAMRCTAKYTVSQADVNRGSINNTATATGQGPTPPGGTAPPRTNSNPSNATVLVTQTPALTLVKTANRATVARAGDKVTYTFTVTNTGTVSMSDVKISENAFSGTGTLSAITCDVTTLAPGAVATCTADYAASQGDVNRGLVTNTATASGQGPNLPDGSTPPRTNSNPSTVTLTAAPEPRLALAKTADPTTVTKAGQVVQYNFDLTNTGNVTLTDIKISEHAFNGTGTLGAITCAPTRLEPSQSGTCRASYTVTQADVDRGSIVNTAKATGLPPAIPGGPPPVPTESNPSTATVTAPPTPALTLAKKADPTTVAKAGDKVTYTFTVTNTGNVTIADMKIDENAFDGTGTLGAITCDVTSLAPEAVATCTADYAASQADVDRGSITNTAKASGQSPNLPDGSTPPRTDSNRSTATVTAPAAPALTLVKSADRDKVANAGDKVVYTFKVTNAGNVTLSDIKIAENAFDGTGTLGAITCDVTSLAPAAVATCTADYAASQADVDRGSVVNTAKATGVPPTVPGQPTPPAVTSDPSSVTVTADPTPSLSLVKSADRDKVANAGDKVVYTFKVTNTGNVTLSDIKIAENAFDGTGTLGAITCDVTSLAPAAVATCTADYAASQADVDRGSVVNTAKATGVPPTVPGQPTPPAVTSDPSSVTVTADPAPSLSLVKSASVNKFSEVGEEVGYVFTVTNTGNVTLTDVKIAENTFNGGGTLSDIACEAGAASLAPAAQVACRATYKVTQADLDRGDLTNTATATGIPPGKPGEPTPPPVPSVPSTVTVPAVQTPVLSLVKSVSSQPLTVGAELTYTFVVTNTGNVTLTDVKIAENAFNGSGTLSDITCEAGAASLAPTAQVLCSATYTVTQADVDRGEVANTATATGVPPTVPGSPPPAPVPSNPSTVKVPGEKTPALELVKTASVDKFTAVGQKVGYVFTVTNTGNVTLTDVQVADNNFNGGGTLSDIACEAAATSLAPGQRLRCTATYTVVQADLDRGDLTNTATATGIPPANPGELAPPPVPSKPSTVTVPGVQDPKLVLVKSASAEKVSRPGEVITYSFVVTNTGNVTVRNVKIAENAFNGGGTLSDIACEAGAASLAPAAQVVCTAEYRVTRADLRGTALVNTAKAVGNGPGDKPVLSNDSTAKVTMTPVLAKTGFDVLPSLLGALGLFLAGGALVLVARTRRS